MESSVQLSVLMPCLNEIKTLGACIEKIHTTCRKLGISYEVLVSDNGSTDGSIELAKSLQARVVHAPQRGYGAALKYGFSQARGEYILFADADDTYDFTEIPKFWDEVKKGADVVIGTRLKGFIQKGAMPPLHRYLGTPVLTALIRILYRIPITDCNSGMRLLKKSVYEKLRMVSSGMEFASEMLIKLGLTRIPIREVPIHLWPDRRGRPPHLKTWRDGWRHLRFILMYAPRQLFVKPGLVFYILGLVGVLAFVRGPLHINSVLFDYHSQLAFATLGLIGFTMWSYGQLIYFFSHIKEFMYDKAPGFYMRLSLEKKLMIGAVTMLLGLVFAANVVSTWAHHGFKDLSEMHKFVASLFFTVSGFMSILLAGTLFTFEYDAKK